jgi:arylformamidase
LARGLVGEENPCIVVPDLPEKSTKMAKSTNNLIGRRGFLAGAGILAAGVARADEPRVFLNYTQKELDDAYTQSVYAPNIQQIQARYAASSADLRARAGEPQMLTYGETANERVLYYRASRPEAPLLVFIHGGAWHQQKAMDYLFPAEVFLNENAAYAAIDFDGVEQTQGRLEPIVDQLCRAVIAVARNASTMGIDPRRIVLAAHSSGAHFGSVLLTTDWRGRYGVAPDLSKSALLISGIYDLRGPRLSVRSGYVKFDDQVEADFSAQRHVDRLQTKLILMTGTRETPEFQRQSRDFTDAVRRSGKPAELRQGAELNHFEMMETLGNPYGIAGRAALELTKAA